MHPLWKMGSIVLGVLVLSTLITALLKKARPGTNLAEVEARIRAWWVMATVFFLAVAGGHTASLILFALISMTAVGEFYRLLKKREADRWAIYLAYASVLIQYYWIYSGWYLMFLIFIPLYVFLLLPMELVLSREAAGFTSSASAMHWGLMAFVFGLSHLGYLMKDPPLGAADGRTMLLFLVFVVEISDVLQFVWGKTLGRHKIIPTISPNKTWEGLIGGIATTTVLAQYLRFLTPFSIMETVLVTVLITVMGFFGGAVMSAIKRDFGVKDFGHSIAGHGGVLDRVDSLVYATPVFFHYLQYFHY